MYVFNLKLNLESRLRVITTFGIVFLKHYQENKT